MKEQSIATFILLCLALTWFVEVLLQADVYPLVNWQVIYPALVYYMCAHVAGEAHERRDEVQHGILSKLTWMSCIVLFVSSNISLLFNIITHLSMCSISRNVMSMQSIVQMSGCSNQTLLGCDHLVTTQDTLSLSIDHERCPEVRLGNAASTFYYLVMCIFRYIPSGVLPFLLHVHSSGGKRCNESSQFYIYDAKIQKLAYGVIPFNRYLGGLVILMACLFVELLPFHETYTFITWTPTMCFLASSLMSYCTEELKQILFKVTADKKDAITTQIQCLSVMSYILAISSVAFALLDFVKNGLFLLSGPCVYDGTHLFPDCYPLKDDVYDNGHGEERCLQAILESNSARSDVRHCPMNKVGAFWSATLYVCWTLRVIILVFYHGFLVALYSKYEPASMPVAYEMASQGGKLPPDIQVVDTSVKTYDEDTDDDQVNDDKTAKMNIETKSLHNLDGRESTVRRNIINKDRDFN